MPAQPLVSIGLMSYNRPADLRNALGSVVAQTYSNLEIIVSDNGSDDPECVRIIHEFAASDSRIKPHYHPVNKGPHFNLTFLLSQASGSFFCWLADDDAFSPAFIADCAAVLVRDAEIVLASNMPVIAGTNEPLEPSVIPDTRNLPLVEKYLRVVRHLMGDLNLFYYSLIRTDALRSCTVHLKRLFGSDLLLLPDLLKAGDFAVDTGKPGYVYAIHQGQTSASLLRYQQIVTKDGADLVERRFFFTAYIAYMIGIIRREKRLTPMERLRIVRSILRLYVTSKRYHLIKYDLGLNALVSRLRRSGSTS